MINFHKQTVEDVLKVKETIYNSKVLGCEFAPSTPFLWGDKYGTTVAFYKDFYLVKGDGIYDFPIHLSGSCTDEQLNEIINDLIEYSNSINEEFTIFGVTQKEIETLNRVFPNKFNFEELRGDFDYIYATNDLIELTGKKFQKKRNHISKFKRTYDYTYKDMTKEDIDDVLAMAKKWCDTNYELKKDEGYFQELVAIEKALGNFEQIGYKGGIITVDGEIIAFTLGEQMNEELFNQHFEKAFSQFDGGYAVINNEFATSCLKNYKYVNREEDMGLEGLRKAKLSYFPEFLVEKYMASLK